MGLSCRRGLGASSCEVVRVSPSGRHPSPPRPEGWGDPPLSVSPTRFQAARGGAHTRAEGRAARCTNPGGGVGQRPARQQEIRSDDRGGSVAAGQHRRELGTVAETPPARGLRGGHRAASVRAGAPAHGATSGQLRQDCGPGSPQSPAFSGSPSPPPRLGVHAGFFGRRVRGKVSALRCFLDSRAGGALPGF